MRMTIDATVDEIDKATWGLKLLALAGDLATAAGDKPNVISSDTLDALALLLDKVNLDLAAVVSKLEHADPAEDDGNKKTDHPGTLPELDEQMSAESALDKLAYVIVTLESGCDGSERALNGLYSVIDDATEVLTNYVKARWPDGEPDGD